MRRQLTVMLMTALVLVLVAAGAWVLLKFISQPYQNNTPSQSQSIYSESTALSQISVLEAALDVAKILKSRDYAALALWVHPEKGVTFTPYSTVKYETDVKLGADDVKRVFTDKTVRSWGTDFAKESIHLSVADYIDSYVYDRDYLSAPEIGTDRIMKEGNLPENVKAAYPGAHFVEFHFSGVQPQYEGMDWSSLKLVMEEYEGNWTLVGVIHSCWTP